jgi:hypothetical protein
MSSTNHGDNIRDQIIGEDAYGRRGALNEQDVYAIIDAMHTNVMDGYGDKETPLLVTLSDFLDTMMQKFDVNA